MLLLNRFVAENPFASGGGGGGVESMARQSVSKLLTEQLNNLAADLISGVELNFDVASTEDYTTGEMAEQNRLECIAVKTTFKRQAAGYRRKQL